MRLSRLESAHGLKGKLVLALIRLMRGADAPDVVKTLLYRPRFFGRPYSELVHQALRGPSQWSVGERELFAAYTSQLNHCRF